jgi:arginase family enzyme
MMAMARDLAVHVDLDGAWDRGAAGLRVVEACAWGPRLRYWARAADIEEFGSRIAEALPRFVLYGSGDFHHLSGVLVRKSVGPLTLVSFDNHPDWDRRPPRWACGGWVNRALELTNVQRVSVWGCGNFELSAPSRWFGNAAALRSGRLQVHAWTERQPPSVQRRFPCMTRETWRQHFAGFAAGLAGGNAYVTVDLDCLRSQEARTNWENGEFTADDVAWAIGELRRQAQVVGGDVCGAYSRPTFQRPFQRFAAWWDHPRPAAAAASSADADMNARSLATIWPSLVG